MKKAILAIATLITLTTCKKDDTGSTFTATDVSGSTLLKGNVNKNIVTPNGSGGWTSTSRIAASNVNVSVKVNKSSLYPNSNAQGADVYSTKTDSLGNYSLNIRSNASGVAAQITIDGFMGTLDTIVLGSKKTGLYSTYAGTSLNRTLFMGQNSQLDYGFVGTAVSSNTSTALKLGTATISGSLAINYLKKVMTGTIVSITTTNVPVGGRKVYLNFSNDPGTLTTRTYETQTDATGAYMFTISTVAAGTPGFSQNANIWVADYEHSRDTVNLNNQIITGRPGVYQGQTINQNGVFNTNIRNANNLLYSSFIPN
ncbi:MAG: hypothetical protein PSX36_03105 [bacterium]|nr:hypothetical protein [bacterium]